MDYKRKGFIQPGIYDLQSKQPFPLKKILYKGHANDSIWEIQIIQHYVNTFFIPTEATLLLPIDNNSIIEGVQVIIGENSYEAKLVDKEIAKMKFSDSIAKGNSPYMASYLDHRNDLLRFNLGKIESNQKLQLSLRIVQKAEIDDKSWSLNIPTSYTPRKLQPQQESISQVLPEYIIRFEITIDSSTKLKRLVNPSHGMEFNICEDRCHATGSLEGIIPGKDFILLYANNDLNKFGVHIQKDSILDEYCLMISFSPSWYEIPEGDTVDTNNDLSYNKKAVIEKKEQGEFLFFLDCSGSMGGTKIQMAKQALQIFLKSLPLNCKYNVICFESSYYKFFPESRLYSKQSLEEGLELTSKIKETGGTEILTPLKDISQQPIDESFPRYLFLLTDGCVSNENQVIEFIEANNENWRVFSLGIGSGCSKTLIRNAAIKGKGCYNFTIEKEDISAKVINLLEKAFLPYYQNINVEWNQKMIEFSKNYALIDNLLYGFHITQEKPTGIMKIVATSNFGKQLTQSFHLDQIETQESKLFQKFAAKDLLSQNKISEIEAKAISLKYLILSQYTAFFLETKSHTITQIYQPQSSNNSRGSQTFIKTLTGKTITVEYEPSDTIQSYKEKIFDKEGIPIEKICLIYASRHLENNKTFMDYNIPSNASLHLIIKSEGCEYYHPVQKVWVKFSDEIFFNLMLII